ncbi:glycosyltransferase family 2 protein [Hymenobacter sp. RP-2-7]|uniref:Glycosyltransferase family 2 protein n=1 Tax=Hymenobacter polaris TaxID=2682546 RepID=A0A7Y0ACN4_9BACT|nr:glycosyltransferase [Hymenobacter polaris]NML64912.1 glycosyltransferase family 2 protein [Hymenobacter polaris]
MPGLSILIPLYNYDATALVAELQAQLAAWPGPVEICLLDDGSGEEFRRRHRPLGALPGVRYAELPANGGRAAVRNALAAKAAHEWLLLLDNDSRLPDGQFLARYAAALSLGAPVLIGGTAYEAAPPADPALHLRWRYGRAREMRPAAERQRDPGGQLAINNALIKKEVLLRFPLDERLSGYGHEDTRLGLQLARAGLGVRHLDNPVLHAGLEPATAFLAKSRQAVRNLAQVLRADGLGTGTRLVRAATRLRQLGLAAPARAALAALGPQLQRNLLSARPRLRALDLLKLGWLLAEDW